MYQYIWNIFGGSDIPRYQVTGPSRGGFWKAGSRMFDCVGTSQVCKAMVVI
jgi:hypothetical protein